MGNQWTCAALEHDYAVWDASRLYCRKCGWIRSVDPVEWCTSDTCQIQSIRHEAHHVDILSIIAQGDPDPRITRTVVVNNATTRTGGL